MNIAENLALLTIISEKHILMVNSNTHMIYPFMTLDDNAEIVHSEMGKDGKWDDEKNEEILKEHLRTLYRKK